MMDQVKTGKGVFIGDIDASLDRLIEEMRTIYGAYLPLHLQAPPPDILEDEDLEAAEEEEAGEDTTEVEDVAMKEDETMDNDENGDSDEDAMMDGDLIVDDEMIDVEEADWTRGPMGGPDMDENETLLERALDVDKEADATEDTEIVRGKRRSRSERVREVAEEEEDDDDDALDDVGVYSVDLHPPIELAEAPETEVGMRSVEDMAREILEMHARDELLKMSEEKFYKLVEPLCLDVGPFREEFVAKIVALAGVDLEDKETEEGPETTDLIELSLSTLDTESDEMEIRERLVDNAEYTPAPVINMAPSTLEAYKDADVLEDEKPQEMEEVVSMPEASAVEEGDVMADEKKQEMTEMPFDEELDTEAYVEEVVEAKGEMDVAEEMRTEDTFAMGVDTEEEISVEEPTTQIEEGIVEETTLSERFDVTTEVPPTEEESEEQPSLEEDREMTETKENGEEEPPIVSEDEDVYDMTDTVPAEGEIESAVPFVNGVEPIDAEPNATEPLSESSSQPDTTATFIDDKPSEVVDDLEDVNTVPETTPAAIEGVTDSEKPAPEVGSHVWAALLIEVCLYCRSRCVMLLKVRSNLSRQKKRRRPMQPSEILNGF